jgi:hypothetical protein
LGSAINIPGCLTPASESLDKSIRREMTKAAEARRGSEADLSCVNLVSGATLAVASDGMDSVLKLARMFGDAIVRRTPASLDLEGRPILPLQGYEVHLALLKLKQWELDVIGEHAPLDQEAAMGQVYAKAKDSNVSVCMTLSRHRQLTMQVSPSYSLSTPTPGPVRTSRSWSY